VRVGGLPGSGARVAEVGANAKLGLKDGPFRLVRMETMATPGSTETAPPDRPSCAAGCWRKGTSYLDRDDPNSSVTPWMR